MRPGQEERYLSQIRRLAAEFLTREWSVAGLVTVSHARLSESGRRVIIFITLFPDPVGELALHEARRLRGPLQVFASEQLKSKKAPYFDVVIDNSKEDR